MKKYTIILSLYLLTLNPNANATQFFEQNLDSESKDVNFPVLKTNDDKKSEVDKHLEITRANFERNIETLGPQEKIKHRLEYAEKVIANLGKKSDPNLDFFLIKPLIEKNILEDPTNLPSYVALANFYFNKNIFYSETDKKDTENALNYIEKALSIDPNYNRALVSKANINFSLGNMEFVNKLVNEKILKIDKSTLTFETIVPITNLLMKINDPNTEAYFEYTYNLAENNLEKARALDLKASKFFMENKYKECIEYYEKALTFDQSSAWRYGNLSACYKYVKNYDSAIALAYKAIEIMDYGVVRRNLSFALHKKAEKMVRKKDYLNAEKTIKESIKYYDFWRPYIVLMNTQLKQNKTDEALKSAITALYLFDAETEKIIGFIAQVVEENTTDYSKFMDNIVSLLKKEDQIGEVIYYISYGLGMQDNRADAKEWAIRGEKTLEKIIETRSLQNRTAEQYVLMSKFQLLKLWLTNDISLLDDANEYLLIANKIDPKQPKVIELNAYIAKANNHYGRNPASTYWKAKVIFSKGLSYIKPDWIFIPF